MKIIGIYSLKNGQRIVEEQFSHELDEIREVITTVDKLPDKMDSGQEKLMAERSFFYKPGSLNRAFKREFGQRGWQTHRIVVNHFTDFYTNDYIQPKTARRAFREIDFIKNRVGVWVQFGKYGSMIYDVCAKMTIFHNHGLIDVGVEIVPVKELANEMSTGVSYFEQFVWDLENRGVADIDIPVLILGITV